MNYLSHFFQLCNSFYCKLTGTVSIQSVLVLRDKRFDKCHHRFGIARFESSQNPVYHFLWISDGCSVVLAEGKVIVTYLTLYLFSSLIQRCFVYIPYFVLISISSFPQHEAVGRSSLTTMLSSVDRWKTPLVSDHCLSLSSIEKIFMVILVSSTNDGT